MSSKVSDEYEAQKTVAPWLAKFSTISIEKFQFREYNILQVQEIDSDNQLRPGTHSAKCIQPWIWKRIVGVYRGRFNRYYRS